MPRAPRVAQRATFDDFEAAIAARPAVDDRLVHLVPLSAVRSSGRNPRQHVDGIDELAASLRAHGLLQPIVVRRHGAEYELIAGHRRFEAARSLEWIEIAAVVRDESDEQAYILTLVENLQREDLSPKEEAAALEVLVRERGWSTRQVAEAIKRSAMHVSKRLRVFDDQALATPVLANQLTVSAAEELLRIPDGERAQLVDQAVAERWGKAEARQAVVRCKAALHQGPPAPRLASRIRALTEELAALERDALPARTRRELARLVATARDLQ